MAIQLLAIVGRAVGTVAEAAAKAAVRGTFNKAKEGAVAPSITIDIDAAGLEKALKNAKRDVELQIQKSLLKTAQFGTQIILDRTERGIGYEGKFKDYSPAYAKFRTKKGRQLTPDLNFIGRMLGSIQQAKESSNVAKIYFGRAEEAKKAAFNNKLRPFFGFNSIEKDRLRRFFNKDFK